MCFGVICQSSYFQTSLSLWHKKKEYLWDWIDSSFQHSFECLFLRFSLSDFCLRSGLFFSHSLSRSSLVRSLSLCFFGFFFLWWLVATCCCWWGDSALPSGGWWLLTLSSGSLPSETGLWGGVNSRSITGRPWVWGPGEGFWVTWLGVLWTSLFVWSTSFCLFTARLSGESKGTGRFCEIKEEKSEIHISKYISRLKFSHYYSINVEMTRELFTTAGCFPALWWGDVSSENVAAAVFGWRLLAWLLICGCSFLWGGDRKTWRHWDTDMLDWLHHSFMSNLRWKLMKLWLKKNLKTDSLGSRYRQVLCERRENWELWGASCFLFFIKR